MSELADESVQLMVTSPPYPMIQMWDDLFAKADNTIAELFQKLYASGGDETVRQIYDTMHKNLAQVWAETYRVLVGGGIACINIGDATRRINGKFQLFPNHSRITEICEKIGFTTLPYILWKKPTTKPMYKGKGAFLGQVFFLQMPMLPLIASLFCCLGRGVFVNSSQKMLYVMRVHLPKSSVTNGLAKSGTLKVPGKQ